MTFFLFGLTSCINKNNQTESKNDPKASQIAIDTNFKLIDDFKNSMTLFRKDTFEIENQALEGEIVHVYHTSEKKYIVVDINLYGEGGRINKTYWTDKKLKPIIVLSTDYEYDKPFYEKDFKTTKTIEYGSFFNNTFLRYDSLRHEINDTSSAKVKEGLEYFLKSITDSIKIIK